MRRADGENDPDVSDDLSDPAGDFVHERLAVQVCRLPGSAGRGGHVLRQLRHGSAKPTKTGNAFRPRVHAQVYLHRCAPMSYDARPARSARFGSDKLEEQKSAKEVSPSSVVPFAVNHDRHRLDATGWTGLRRPGLEGPGDRGDMTAVYVPYGLPRTHTY
jgi:hypothetical protein